MSEQKFQLIVKKGPQVGQVFHLDAHSLIIGRDPMSDIIINDPEISRQHARLTKLEAGYQLEDLGSTNGTFVEGERLGSEAITLEPGQAVNMGSGVRVIYAVFDPEQSRVSTMIDTASPLAPSLEPAVTDDLYLDAELVEDDLSDEAAYPSPFGGPVSDVDLEPEFEQAPQGEREPDVELITELPAAEESGRSSRRIIIALVVVMLLLLCCCVLTLFMYYVGGDLILDSL